MAIMLTNKRHVSLAFENVAKGTAAAAAVGHLLAENVICEPTAEWIQRKGGGKFLGNTIPGMIGAKTGTISFRAELRGAGSNAFDAALLILFQGCGVDISVPASLKLYSDIEAQKTLTFWVYEDGILKKISGAMCELRITGEQGKPLYLEVTAHGMWTDPTTTAMGTWTPTTIKPPLLGSGAFNLDVVTVSTEMVINSFTLDLGNELVFRDNHYAIGNRNVTLGIDPEAQTTKLVYSDWSAGTEGDASLTVVDSAADTMTFTFAKVQHMDIGVGDRNGVQTHDMNLQCNVSSLTTGNDEFTLAIA